MLRKIKPANPPAPYVDTNPPGACYCDGGAACPGTNHPARWDR